MCGICGIALREGLVEKKRLQAMTDVLHHRGPDDGGIMVDHNVGLGHRRLSIVDLQGGHQPMTNEDGSIWIAYNGEIYNHEEIRKRLIGSGHKYKTKSDTETILHLYEDTGPSCVEKLRGMFAFSLWDSENKKLILARDRVGIKPLYYFFEQGNLVWGSEIKAILESEYVRPKLEMKSLPAFLANRYTSGENTLFEGIKRLLPGHLLTWQDGHIKIIPYWKLEFSEPEEPSKENDIVDEFTRIFEESVKMRLMSDVPLGMFLSGGIDSSAIAAVMSKMVDQPIKTFSVGFEEREANELYYARLISQRYGTDHHEVIITPNEFFVVVPRLIWQEDEPIAFPSSIPLYFLSKLARKHVKVVLTGEGSDELLAGYGKYKKTLLNFSFGKAYENLIPAFARSALREIIEKHSPLPLVGEKLKRTFFYLKPEIESLYFDNFSVFSRHALKNLFSFQTLESLNSVDPYEVEKKHFYGDGVTGLLNSILYTDIKTYLQELLMKQDQMSMAASIESRVPFLDHKLVEFVANISPEYKIRGWTTKYLLRKSMQNVLPREVLQRKKMGFPVPIGQWFRRGRFIDIKEYLLGSRTTARGLFNRKYIEKLLNSHNSGQQDHSERLWCLFNLEIWNRIFIDGELMWK